MIKLSPRNIIVAALVVVLCGSFFFAPHEQKALAQTPCDPSVTTCAPGTTGNPNSSPAPAPAATSATSTNWCTDVCSYLAIGIGYIASFVIEFLGYLLSWAVGALIWVGSYNDFITSPAVGIGWSVVRDIGNMFFVLVLLVIAFGTILHLEQYQMKRLLPKLLLMAVLVNFSKAIAGLLIDFSQVVMLTFVQAYSTVGAGNILDVLNIKDISNFNGGEIKGGIDVVAVATSYLFAAAVVLVSLVVVVAMLFIFVIRIVALWILVVFSPFAYVLSVVPMGAKYAGQWWETFSKYVIVGPVMAFLLWLSLASLTAVNANLHNDKSLQSINSGLSGQQQQFQAQIPQATRAGVSAGAADKMIGYIISIAMLMMSLVFAQGVGSAVGKVAGTAYGKLTTAGTRVARGVAMLPVRGARAAGTYGANAVSDRLQLRQNTIKALGALGRVPGLGYMTGNAIDRLARPASKVEEDEERWAKRNKKNDQAMVNAIGSSGFSPQERARRDAAIKERPDLAIRTGNARHIADGEKVMKGYKTKDYGAMDERQFQRVADTAIGQYGPGVLTQLPQLEKFLTTPQNSRERNLFEGIYGVGAPVITNPTSGAAYATTPVPPPPDLYTRYSRGLGDDFRSKMTNERLAQFKAEGKTEEDFYNSAEYKDGVEKGTYLSEDERKTRAQGGAAGNIRAETVNVQGGEIRMRSGPGDAESEKMNKAAKDAMFANITGENSSEYEQQYQNTHQAIEGISLNNGLSYSDATTEFFKRQGEAGDFDKKLTEGKYLSESQFAQVEAKKDYDPSEIYTGHIQKYLPGGQLEGEHIEAARLGVDFDTFSDVLDPGASGAGAVNLTGASKEKVIPKLIASLKSKGAIKDGEEDQVHDLLRNAESIHLTNNARFKERDDRNGYEMHETFHDPVGNISKEERREMFAALPQQKQSEVLAAQSANGINDKDLAIEEYFVESLKNAIGAGQKRAKDTEVSIKAAGGADAFYNSAEYKNDEAERQRTGKGKFMSRNERGERNVMELDPATLQKFVAKGVIKQGSGRAGAPAYVFSGKSQAEREARSKEPYSGKVLPPEKVQDLVSEMGSDEFLTRNPEYQDNSLQDLEASLKNSASSLDDNDRDAFMAKIPQWITQMKQGVVETDPAKSKQQRNNAALDIDNFHQYAEQSRRVAALPQGSSERRREMEKLTNQSISDALQATTKLQSPDLDKLMGTRRQEAIKDLAQTIQRALRESTTADGTKTQLGAFEGQAGGAGTMESINKILSEIEAGTRSPEDGGQRIQELFAEHASASTVRTAGREQARVESRDEQHRKAVESNTQRNAQAQETFVVERRTRNKEALQKDIGSIRSSKFTQGKVADQEKQLETILAHAIGATSSPEAAAGITAVGQQIQSVLKRARGSSGQLQQGDREELQTLLQNIGQHAGVGPDVFQGRGASREAAGGKDTLAAFNPQDFATRNQKAQQSEIQKLRAAIEQAFRNSPQQLASGRSAVQRMEQVTAKGGRMADVARAVSREHETIKQLLSKPDANESAGRATGGTDGTRYRRDVASGEQPVSETVQQNQTISPTEITNIQNTITNHITQTLPQSFAGLDQRALDDIKYRLNQIFKGQRFDRVQDRKKFNRLRLGMQNLSRMASLGSSDPLANHVAEQGGEKVTEADVMNELNSMVGSLEEKTPPTDGAPPII